MGIHEIIFFSGFLLFIALMLLIDLGVFNKKDHIVSFKEAGIWSLIWVSFALGFYALLLTNGQRIHGIENFQELSTVISNYVAHPEDIKIIADNFEASLQNYRQHIALEFITGYLLEYSLSVDNIFVIIMVFTSFGVKKEYYKKVLLWGIIGAIIMRFIFIFLGSVLIQNLSWILYIFAAFLIYSGLKMLFSKDEDENIDPENHPVVRFLGRYFAVHPHFVGSNFFYRPTHDTATVKKGALMITPLFVTVVVVEMTDLIFAVDSVPAVFSVTKDPYIVFFSNIFAIMGLRSMFYFLSNIMHLFHYLKTGLSFLLIFIGAKMFAHGWLKGLGFENYHSLLIVVSILAISVLASLIFPKSKEAA
ncbi:MAG: TerC/Alx family metal homeostasis membrane protein [Cytophagales bacterium]|nr:MAG: TerC/Alx family metal homeostasis membrane protein [Cytophagales bacterium]TAF59332.1 MAG: TerC/Alx family metal homeostasis membrane protein [Cytophagales bacterium]